MPARPWGLARFYPTPYFRLELSPLEVGTCLTEANTGEVSGVVRDWGGVLPEDTVTGPLDDDDIEDNSRR